MRKRIIEVARSYCGTPFHHQGRLPGTGLDCAGVVVCALNECGYQVNDRANYGRIPAEGEFMRAIWEHCNSVQLVAIAPGDLMMFAFRTEPQHVALISQIDPIMLIHSWQDVGKVVENGFDNAWQTRLRGCYRLKGID